MTHGPARSSKALLASVGLVIAAGAVLGTSLTVFGEQQTPSAPPEVPPPVEDRVEPEPRPEPEPEPEPEPQPVTGVVEVVDVVDVSTAGTGVFQDGSSEDAAVAIDEAAVDEFATAIGAWLDEHLTDVQRGGMGTIPALQGDTTEFSSAPDSGSEPETEPHSGSGSGAIVAEAVYELTIFARGVPEWAEATVTVVREDVSVTSVLAILPGDEPSLVAAELTGLDDDRAADDPRGGT